MDVSLATKNKLNTLKQLIINQLGQLINTDYIFLDLPYYTNIGDTLIWKGTEDMLTNMPRKCIYRASIETYVRPDITKDITILLQGGGNFGDMWRRHTEFVLRVLQDFPENKVIILSQTVHYSNNATLMADALQMSNHKNLIICARDVNSYNILNQHFKVSKILLIPDMAFCINEEILTKYSKKPKNKSLFFLRNDVEKAQYDYHNFISEDQVDISDWPSMNQHLIVSKILILLTIIRKRIPNSSFFKKLINAYAIKIYMPYLLKIGIQFISSYNKVYSTRLHGAILAILLKKEVVFFDNSYGKSSSFFECWLKDLENVSFITKDS